MTKNEADTGSVPEYLHEAVDKIEKFMELGLWAQAQAMLADLTGQLDGLGILSTYLLWLTGVVCDSIGLLPEAIEHIVRARRMDPLFPRAITSERIILARVAALIEIAGPEDAHVSAIVCVVRRLYPTGHPAVRVIEDKLDQKAQSATETTPRRAQA